MKRPRQASSLSTNDVDGSCMNSSSSSSSSAASATAADADAADAPVNSTTIPLDTTTAVAVAAASALSVTIMNITSNSYSFPFVAATIRGGGCGGRRCPRRRDLLLLRSDSQNQLADSIPKKKSSSWSTRSVSRLIVTSTILLWLTVITSSSAATATVVTATVVTATVVTASTTTVPTTMTTLGRISKVQLEEQQRVVSLRNYNNNSRSNNDYNNNTKKNVIVSIKETEYRRTLQSSDASTRVTELNVTSPPGETPFENINDDTNDDENDDGDDTDNTDEDFSIRQTGNPVIQQSLWIQFQIILSVLPSTTTATSSSSDEFLQDLDIALEEYLQTAYQNRIVEEDNLGSTLSLSSMVQLKRIDLDTILVTKKQKIRRRTLVTVSTSLLSSSSSSSISSLRGSASQPQQSPRDLAEDESSPSYEQLTIDAMGTVEYSVQVDGGTVTPEVIEQAFNSALHDMVTPGQLEEAIVDNAGIKGVVQVESATVVQDGSTPTTTGGGGGGSHPHDRRRRDHWSLIMGLMTVFLHFIIVKTTERLKVVVLRMLEDYKSHQPYL
jgi:methionine-rich copper-binding protein CopC